MPLITPQDFKVETYIPSTTEEATIENVQSLIDKYTPAFLDMLYGKSMATLFIAGFDETSGRWFDLASNIDLKNALKNFVYFYWVRYNNTYTTHMGEKKGEAQNSSSITSKYKTVDRWNEMVDLCRGLYENIDRTIYPECIKYNRVWGYQQWMPDIFHKVNFDNI